MSPLRRIGRMTISTGRGWMPSRRTLASKGGGWICCGVAAAVDDDRRARSRYANIARQQGKRTANEQKKEKTKVRGFCDSYRNADSRHRQSIVNCARVDDFFFSFNKDNVEKEIAQLRLINIATFHIFLRHDLIDGGEVPSMQSMYVCIYSLLLATKVAFIADKKWEALSAESFSQNRGNRQVKLKRNRRLIYRYSILFLVLQTWTRMNSSDRVQKVLRQRLWIALNWIFFFFFSSCAKQNII